MKNFSTIINDKDIITVEYQKNNSVLFSESQTLTDEQKSQARSNIGAGTSDFDGTWDSLSGKPNVVQSIGQSTSDIMSQKAVTDELDKKANRSGDTFIGDVIISSGNSLKTDTIKSADGTKWIAEITAAGLEIGGQGAPLRLYSSTRPIHANVNKELAYTSDIPTNYVTTENTTQNISGKKTVVTPPATDDSTQIANTEWVRTNYQEKGYAGIDGAVVNSDGKVTDKDGKVVDALYFKVASLTTSKAYLRTYLLAEVAMTNVVKEQATVLIRCTTESSTSAPNVTITLDNYSYVSLLLPKNIFVTADYKSGTAGATFTVWVKQDKDFMQQVWNVLSQNTRNYTTTSKREWSVFYSNITKATAVTDINAAPTGYTRIVANNNNRYSNLEENTYLWQQSQNAGITWKRYSDNTTRGIFRHYDDGTTETFVTQSNGFLFRPLDNNNTKSIKVDPKIGALYPEQNAGADLGKTAQRWNNGYITNLQLCKVINGGGGNSMIQQNSDTSGADIIVGSTKCALKIIGKYGRPEYRQGKNGTYVNLALHSDINNGTLTILKNGGSLGSFSANQSSDVDIDIDVPENLSELTNDIKVLRNNTDKSHSLSIAGTNDLDSAATDTYCIAIGPAAMARYTKTIKIGTGLTPNNQSVTQIGTNSYTSSGRALYLGAGNTGFTYMNSAGSSWSSASDIRDKTDIQTIDHALDFIKKLKPITYVMNDRERYLIRDKDDNPILDENGKQQYDVEAHKRGDKKKHRRFAGLSAQDTYQAMLDCYNNDTNYAQIVDNNKFDHPDDEYLEQYSMSYERLVPFLIKAIQEQQEQIEKLKSKLGE